MLEFQKVNVSFQDTPVLNDFSLTLKRGEIIALVGESGSGKSTVVRAAMGLLPAGGVITQGNIVLDGKSLTSLGKKEHRAYLGTQLSMIFQDSASMLNPVRSIGSQFVEFIQAHEKVSKKEANCKAKRQLENMQLPHVDTLMKSIPSVLSGGMRQRVGIAMAMTFVPQVLFADEPTSALDVSIQAQIVRQLVQLREDFGTSLIVVTHNLAVAAYVADRIIVMKGGSIVESGRSDSIVENPIHPYTKELISAVPDLKRSKYVY